MTENLKLVKENAYLKLGIIALIEEFDGVEELRSIKDFLKDLIDGVEENTRKRNAENVIKFFNEAIKDSDD